MIKHWLVCIVFIFSLGNALAESSQEENRDGFLSSWFGADKSEDPGSELERLLADVEKRYGETLASLRKINLQIAKIRREMEKIRHEIDTTKRLLDIESAQLADQARSAYLLGAQQEVKLLFNKQDLAHSGLVMGYYKVISDKRLAKFQSIQSRLEALDQRDAERQAEANQLAEQLKLRQSEQLALQTFRMERDKLLSNPELGQPQALNEEKIKQLLATLPSLDKLAAEQQEAAPVGDELPEISEEYLQLNGSLTNYKGLLPWPLQAKNAVLRPVSSLNGVSISAREGTEVHAISAGKVVFSNWLKGFGWLIIIKHEGDFMTLYAFNEGLYKKEGESVRAGDVIASVGKSGGRGQPALYFEIRHDKKPVSPLAWCKH